ncbi:MAG: hypothetical protein K6T59_11820 [Bryobacteraceae bacterium]|nr:hypothetical protein [Bryobacteraceae bacterium]
MSAPLPLDAAWMRAHGLPSPGDGGKDERGRVLVIGGEIELAGAAMLAGVAALRAGAGKLQVAVAEQAVAAVTVALPEARVLALPRDTTGRVSDQAVEVVIDNASRCDALLIGPGMMDDRAGLAKTLLAEASSRAVIVDAGALDDQALRTYLEQAADRDVVLDLSTALRGNIVATATRLSMLPKTLIAAALNGELYAAVHTVSNLRGRDTRSASSRD